MKMDSTMRNLMRPLIKDANEMISSISSLIRNTMVYRVSISRSLYMLECGIGKIFKNTDLYVVQKRSPDNENGYELAYKSDVDNRMTMRDINDFVIFEGSPIWLTIKHRECENGTYNIQDAMLSTIKTDENIKKLKKLINMLFYISSQEAKKKWHGVTTVQSVTRGNIDVRLRNHKMRTLDDVFLPIKNKHELKTSVDKFVKKRSWYIDNNIPYHFGILLYGVPGTGKSSLAQAIANHLNANLIVISGDEITKIPEFCNMHIINRDTITPDTYQVILVEDIDCGFKTDKDKRSDPDDKRDGVNGLATILNTFDGIGAPRNTIYVFTTNHIEKLDPALIRPGRIDLKIEVGYVNNETFIQFCEFHYKTTPDLTGIKVKDGLTFAALQTLVMKDMTMEELINEVKEE